MTNRAEFSIEASAASDRGYDALPGAVLTVALEDSDVTSAVVDCSFTSGSAPSFTNSGVLNPTSGSVDITLPADPYESYMIRMTVVYSSNGRVRQEVFERLVAVRSAAGRRKILPSEGTQYDPIMAWCGEINDIIPHYPLAIPGASSTTLPTAPRNVVFNGQSNMVAAPTGTYGTSFCTQYLAADIQGWSDLDQGWLPLQEGGANMRTIVGVGPLGASGPGAGQVGTPLMRAITDRLPVGQKSYCWSLAYSGQGIDYFRSNSATEAYYQDGTQHATLNNFDLLNQEIETSGREPDLYVFMQGEADWGTAQATYYAKIKELFSELTLLYPGMHFIIVKTIHASNPANGVALAQQQLADENPHIHAIDCSDMQTYTAWWGGLGGQHYTNAGYKEVYRRIDALLLGLDARPSVAAVQHIDDLITWHHRYGEIHYTTGVGAHNLALWSDSSQLGAGANKSLGAITSQPTSIPGDPEFGGVSVVKLERATSDALFSAIDESSDKWSVFIVAKLDGPEAAPPNQALFSMYDYGDGRRCHATIPAPTAGEDFSFADGTLSFNDVAPLDIDEPHSYGFVIDIPNNTARVYYDGVLTATYTGAFNSAMSAPTFWIGSLIGAGGFFLNGKVASISVAAGTALDDTQAAACHAWAEIAALP